jgi:hypothetical protein
VAPGATNDFSNRYDGESLKRRILDIDSDEVKKSSDSR